MNEYLQQAQDFLAKTNATMQIDFRWFRQQHQLERKHSACHVPV